MGNTSPSPCTDLTSSHPFLSRSRLLKSMTLASPKAHFHWWTRHVLGILLWATFPRWKYIRNKNYESFSLLFLPVPDQAPAPAPLLSESVEKSFSSQFCHLDPFRGPLRLRDTLNVAVHSAFRPLRRKTTMAGWTSNMMCCQLSKPDRMVKLHVSSENSVQGSNTNALLLPVVHLW